MTARGAAPALDRERLARVLGLMGSSHDGEALAAARKACALIRVAGLTWPEILTGRAPQRPGLAADNARLRREIARLKAQLAAASPADPRSWSWSLQLELCRARRANLSPWESEFVDNIAARAGGPSPRQAAVLSRIAAKAAARDAPWPR